MTTIYSNNFDAETTGALPAGWTAKVGTWAIQAAGGVSGSKSFGCSPSVDGNAVLYTAATARADMQVSSDGVILATASYGNRLPYMSHILRSDAAYANCYLVIIQDIDPADTQFTVVIYKKVGGSISLVSQGPNPTIAGVPATGDVYHMTSKIVGSTISVYVWKNAETMPATPTYTATDSSVAAAGYAGLYNSTMLQTAPIAADNFVLDDAVAAAAGFTLTGATSVDGFVFQRSGTTATANFAGTYTGTPAAIQARIVNTGTNTAVTGFDWATVVATPTGNAFSFSFASVPQGGFYQLQLRDSAVPGTITTATAFGVGIRVACIGQSNIETLFMYQTATPDARLRFYERNITIGQAAGTWANSSAGAGAVALGNALIAAAGGTIPVALICYAVSGAGLQAGAGLATTTSGGVARYWLDTSAGSPWSDFNIAMNLIGASVEMVIYGQGESDAMTGVTPGNYGAALATLFTRIRTLLGSTTKIVLPLLGQSNHSGATDADWNTVRQQQIAAAAADTACYPVSKPDLQCQAGSPDLSFAALVVWGARLAQKVAHLLGYVTYSDGPKIQSVAAVTSTTYDITLQHFGGTDFTPTTGISDLRVLDGTTVLTPSSIVRQAANKIRITLATAPAGTVTVQASYGKLPATQTVVLDNSALALPLQSSVPVTAAAIATRTVTLTLNNRSGTAQASLSGLKWAFFDQATPNLLSAPALKGSAATTNGSGVITLDVTGTSLGAGGVGWLVISDSNGLPASASNAFSGPVTVA